MPDHASRSLARLGDYELVRRIASGGMAEVYEARRPGPRGFAKRVALKRILPELASDPRQARAFCAEARVHAALTHPNLVSVLDFGEASGQLFLVMEYVDGVSLSEVLGAVAARKRAVELSPALYVAREVAAGLLHAHQYRDDQDAPRGVVHGDVAPENILIGRSGEVKLTNFGLVRSAWSGEQSASGQALPARGYVAPERTQGRGADVRSDLFSLGAVLADMLVGLPITPAAGGDSSSGKVAGCAGEDLSRLPASTPEIVRSLLRRLLAKSPRNRPHDAGLVVGEIDRIMASLGARSSARDLSLWLTDLGVVRIESGVRSSPMPSGVEAHRPDGAGSREEQATIVDADALKPIEIALPAPLADPRRERTAAAPTLRYRLRRPGGEIVGPMSLSSVLAMLATARAGLDSELAREEGPFWKLSRAFELTRLASRPLYRFFEPIAVLATERHPVLRVSLAAHLLRLALHGRSGLLVWRHGTEQRRVYFEGGEPKATASTEPSELLGKQLVRDGFVAEGDLERVLESGYRSGCQVGDSLVRAGLLSNEQLARAIAAQRLQRLTALCRASSGELFFVDGATSGEQVVSVASSPVQPLLDALRDAYSTAELITLLAGLERSALAPAPSCAAIRSALCSSADEAYAFELCARGVKIGLILREARARGEAPLRAAAFSVFMGLSAGAFSARVE